MDFKDVIPHSCECCRRLIIDFRSENMEEFNARHAEIRAADPTPRPSPRPSTMTDGRMKKWMFKFDVSRSEIIQFDAEGCPLCSFLVDKCKVPDGSQDDKVLELWGEDLSGPSDSFNLGKLGFGWAKPSNHYPKLNTQVFAVYALQNNVAGRRIKTRPVNLEPGSMKSFDVARSWLSNCLQNKDHGLCRRKASTFMPTRLIEITQSLEKNERQKTWRVRLTHPKQPEPYVALSYCWGGDQPLKAARNTEIDWLDGIDWQLLPPTLRDAVITSSELDIRFIWIDALCILQDDDEDKAREISKMPEIYTHALLTISAARAASVHEGFLHCRSLETDITSSPNLIFELPYQCPSDELGCVTLLRAYEDKDEPTMTRAWTLQEGLLSTRVLEFGTRKTSWYCQYESYDKDGHKTAYTDGWRETSYRRDGGMYTLDFDHEVFRDRFKEQSDWQRRARAMGTRSALELWLKTVQGYTSRALSFPADKLLAISAIAEKYGTIFNDEYLAGLWRFSLPVSLVWSVNSPYVHDGKLFPRPKSYRAPSWSWVSVEGSVWLDLGRTAMQETMGIASQNIICQVLTCDVELSNKSYPYGAVTGGVLTIKGTVRNAMRSRDNELLVNRNSNSEEDGIGEYRKEGWLEYCPDDQSMQGEHEHTSVLLLGVLGFGEKNRPSPGKLNFRGLVLQKLDDDRFRRVGLFLTGQSRIRSEPLFDDSAWPLLDDCPEQVVTVV